MATANTPQAQEAQSPTTRPPIVVVLGHVDHGKSSLLEAIREDFQITSRESGGITQHIGAYVAEYQGKKITFLDTPGHEAFSAMRARGAKVADIAVLVVAADDGVQAQTREAIATIKKSAIPFVVAISKVDKPGIDEERVKRDLGAQEVFVESLGGKVPSVAVSALKRQGMSELLETILLVAELEDLKADISLPARGVVIEASIDSKRGPAATLLVGEGTLKIGDIAGTSTSLGKIRILEDARGNALSEVLPGTPAVAIGFHEAPGIGEEFAVFPDEESAKRQIVPLPARQKTSPVILAEEGKKAVNIILKADVKGSLEALEHLLLSLPQQNTVLRIVEGSIGEISENDVKLAQGTKARIFGFHTKAGKTAQAFAEREHIAIETFDVIYDLAQRVRQLLEKSKELEIVEQEIGTLKVLAVFFTEKNRQIVGGKVVEGEVRKGAGIQVFRGDALLGQGRVVNLQKDKKDAAAVLKGDECGILYEGTGVVREGDMLKFFVKETRTSS